MFRTCLTWRLCLALLAVAGSVCLAAAPPAAAPPNAVASASAANDDAAAKKQILDSSAWRQAMLGFNEWLSVQVVYEKDEVPRVKAQLRDKINKMSPAQLRAFLEDLQQKLAILGSKEAIDDRAYAEDYLTTASAGLVEKFRAKLPDVVNMTSAQLQQALYDLQQRRKTQAASQKAFEQARDQQVANIREMNRQTAEANAAAEAQMSSSSGDPYPGYWGGGYAPVKYSGYAPPSPVSFPAYFGGWRW